MPKALALVGAVAILAALPSAFTTTPNLDDPYVLQNARSPESSRYLWAYSVDCPGVDCATAWWAAPPYRRHFVRFLPSLVLKAATMLAGGSRLGLCLFGLGAHVATCLLLLVVLVAYDVERRWAMTVASLFAAHPAGAELSGAVSFLCVPLAAACVLSSLVWLRRFSEQRRNRDAVLCLASAFVAMTSYEAAVLLPLVLLVAARPRTWLVAATLALWPVYFAIRVAVHAGDIARPLGVLVADGVRLSATETIGYLVEVAALPPPGTRPGLIAATVVSLALVAVVVVWSRRRPLAGLGVVMFVALLAPPVLVRALIGVFNHPTLRQLYLPLLGAALIVAAVTPRPRAFAAAWLCVGFFVATSWQLSDGRRQNGAFAAQVRRALADVDAATPVMWIGQPPRYDADPRGRRQFALVPPPVDDGELRVCAGPGHQLVAVAPSGFAGRTLAPKPPGPDFLAAIFVTPDVFRTGDQELPVGHVHLDSPTALRFTLGGDVALLRFQRGQVSRVRPTVCLP